MVRLLSRPAQHLARDGPSSAVALGSIELMPAKDGPTMLTTSWAWLR